MIRELKLDDEVQIVADVLAHETHRVVLVPIVPDRALELAKAEHARMGAAMRACLPGHENVIVTAWHDMKPERRNVMVAVWRALLDDGVVA